MEEFAATTHMLPQSLMELRAVERLFFFKRVQPLACLYSAPRNMFIIRNEIGQYLFFVRAISVCSESCFSALPLTRYFEILDAAEHDMLYLKCPWSWSPMKMEIAIPPGNPLGYIKKKLTFWWLHLHVVDCNGITLLQIKRSPSFNFCSDITYEILSADGRSQIGTITKIKLGFTGSLFTGADRYELKFPINLEVRKKALIIGACLQIDLIHGRR